MLGQLDVLEPLNQIGFIGRHSVTYRDGKRVTSRGWHPMYSRMGETHLDYQLNIRQAFTESVFRAAFEDHGHQVLYGWKLKSFTVDEDAADGYKITAYVEGSSSGTLKAVRR